MPTSVGHGQPICTQTHTQTVYTHTRGDQHPSWGGRARLLLVHSPGHENHLPSRRDWTRLELPGRTQDCSRGKAKARVWYVCVCVCGRQCCVAVGDSMYAVYLCSDAHTFFSGRRGSRRLVASLPLFICTPFAVRYGFPLPMSVLQCRSSTAVSKKG